VISGVIGSGKTSLTTDLADYLGYTPIYEPVADNPYLSDFYKDPKRWAYPMQERLKSMRFRLHQDSVWGIRSGRYKGVIADRSIHEDSIFAEINHELGNICERDWETYLAGFEDMKHFLMEPDAIIFLDASPETCKARADQRDRPEERNTALGPKDRGIPLDYLQKLHARYSMWAAEVANRIPLIPVPWEEFRPAKEVWEYVLRRLDFRSRFNKNMKL